MAVKHGGMETDQPNNVHRRNFIKWCTATDFMDQCTSTWYKIIKREKYTTTQGGVYVILWPKYIFFKLTLCGYQVCSTSNMDARKLNKWSLWTGPLSVQKTVPFLSQLNDICFYSGLVFIIRFVPPIVTLLVFNFQEHFSQMQCILMNKIILCFCFFLCEQ